MWDQSSFSSKSRPPFCELWYFLMVICSEPNRYWKEACQKIGMWWYEFFYETPKRPQTKEKMNSFWICLTSCNGVMSNRWSKVAVWTRWQSWTETLWNIKRRKETTADWELKIYYFRKNSQPVTRCDMLFLSHGVLFQTKVLLKWNLLKKVHDGMFFLRNIKMERRKE